MKIVQTLTCLFSQKVPKSTDKSEQPSASSTINTLETFSTDSPIIALCSERNYQLSNKLCSGKSNTEDTKCHLFTDSMSSLKALQKFNPTNNLIEEIKSLLDGTISLHWVKAHIEVAGNETEDKAAKEASTKQMIDFQLGIPEISFKTSIRHSLRRNGRIAEMTTTKKGGSPTTYFLR
ncbi:hypothetical protein AVEN_216246-1 [Araneus ventricosus]|uniref:Uncharacterized protein n=1 Tax=Araneus ventricosus TaxID=182803 RepID=A0A4Y2HQV7_ARAVE|nr:hypothetical protein AVEN_216246-1 [Araneus ventricosus]